MNVRIPANETKKMKICYKICVIGSSWFQWFKRDLWGTLLYAFFQCLEGEQEVVEQLFSKKMKDTTMLNGYAHIPSRFSTLVNEICTT